MREEAMRCATGIDEGDAIDCELTSIAGGLWSAKELARERARFMLSRIKPLHAWLDSLAEHGPIENAIGPAGDFYERVVAVLQREIEHPSAHVIRVDEHGRARFVWRRP